MKKNAIFFTLICGLFAGQQSSVSSSDSLIFMSKNNNSNGCEIKNDDIFSGNATCQIEDNNTKIDTNSTKK